MILSKNGYFNLMSIFFYQKREIGNNQTGLIYHHSEYCVIIHIMYYKKSKFKNIQKENKGINMKIKYIISLLLVFVLSGVTCYSKTSAASQGKQEETTKKKNKILIVYFSMPETANPNNMSREEDNSVVVVNGKVKGNTEYVASVIQEHTGGDIYRIEPEIPYPIFHKTLVDQAKEEKKNNARPKIKMRIKNPEKYNTIFIGYPNWWGDMPMILYTFFDTYDFKGKKIIPFITHGGSGFSDTINTIEKLEPAAEVVKKGYSISRNTVQNARFDIIAWLKTLGY
jgi:flavodoxin